MFPQDAENIDNIQLSLINKDLLLTNPYLLLNTINPETIDIINNVLPFSIGIEIECDNSENYNIKNFSKIPYLIAIDCDSSEKRFRIPNGLLGLICLYNICEELKYNCIYTESGIHFHVDCTEDFVALEQRVLQDEEKEYILKELDKWGYQWTYNTRDITYSHGWIRIQPNLQTLECRICEMTFDYTTLLKRIYHLSNVIQIVRKKNNLDYKIIYNDLNDVKVIDTLMTAFDNLNSNITKEKIISNLEEQKNSYDVILQRKKLQTNTSVNINNRTKKFSLNG